MNAKWILGRVLPLENNRVLITLTDDRENVITRDQAIQLGTRLLEVGIGTNFAHEREINAQIGDLISKARNWRS